MESNKRRRLVVLLSPRHYPNAKWLYKTNLATRFSKFWTRSRGRKERKYKLAKRGIYLTVFGRKEDSKFLAKRVPLPRVNVYRLKSLVFENHSIITSVWRLRFILISDEENDILVHRWRGRGRKRQRDCT